MIYQYKHDECSCGAFVIYGECPLKLWNFRLRNFLHVLPLFTAWAEEKDNISNHHVLRLIYQGRFLHENVTFSGLPIFFLHFTVKHPSGTFPESYAYAV